MSEEPIQQKDTKTPQPEGNGTFQLKVYSPFKVYFDEPAISVSAINDTGPFDILGKHHNFMTLINACDLVINMPRGEEKITIQRGIMHVKTDEVTVFLDV